MKLTKEVIDARLLRLAWIRSVYLEKGLPKRDAEACLALPLDPEDESTFVDDSALLEAPDALERIRADLEQA